MGRVKIQFPDYNPLFTATIPVRTGDLNYANHVGNDAVLSIIHEARMQMLRHHGYTEMSVAGNSMIMADVMIAYKAESFYGDILTVKVYAEEITGTAFNLLYRVSTTRNDNQLDIAHGKTGMVCFDYTARKIAAITDALTAFLKKGQPTS